MALEKTLCAGKPIPAYDRDYSRGQLSEPLVV